MTRKKPSPGLPPPALAALLSVLLLAGCSNATSRQAAPEPEAACTFTNPVGPGQDPYVVRYEGMYYLVESRGNAIHVYRSEKLTEIKANPVKVWEPPAEGWNRMHLWAPELHFIGGRWYIYYAAGAAGPPFVHQRSGVLESTGADPQGPYVDRGLLFTGDAQDDSTNVWSIDLTVGRIGGRFYAVWSGWEQNRDTDKTPQHLYIAALSNPWTIGSARVRISSPEEPWEVGTELDINEGPQFLLHGGDVFIIYSTRESWLKAYRLGQLRLRSPEADPLDPTAWRKSGPVFIGTDEVLGVGHASFTTSPDGTEDWIVYHTKVSETPGWERVIHMQPFRWNAEGAPDFGTPAASGEALAVPSGQCN